MFKEAGDRFKSTIEKKESYILERAHITFFFKFDLPHSTHTTHGEQSLTISVCLTI